VSSHFIKKKKSQLKTNFPEKSFLNILDTSQVFKKILQNFFSNRLTDFFTKKISKHLGFFENF